MKTPYSAEISEEVLYELAETARSEVCRYALGGFTERGDVIVANVVEAMKKQIVFRRNLETKTQK